MIGLMFVLARIAIATALILFLTGGIGSPGLYHGQAEFDGHASNNLLAEGRDLVPAHCAADTVHPECHASAILPDSNEADMRDAPSVEFFDAAVRIVSTNPTLNLPPPRT
ncbi:MAG: hypothetical protein QNJ44_15670 [Rhodobacter sp.]|nr:hypothetical protein [Rhodobacter sp.]